MNVEAEGVRWRREREAVPAAPGADARAFTAWVAPHWEVLHRLAARLCGVVDGDDVLQEALGAAWRKRHQFDPERGSVRAWLAAITVDQSRKHRQRSRFDRSLVLADEAGGGADGATASVVAMDVWRAVEQISDRQRLAVVLFYYVDLSIGEVARVMACSEGTVKSTLADARRRLSTILGSEY